MTDLIDFSELENDENVCPDGDGEQENRAPKLVQSPVIVNPILKQSTKDNLIQLYTPVQKPVKGKLKVTFGCDTVLQTPNVKRPEKAPIKLKEVVLEKQVTDDQEKEEWRDRTSVLTSIDHQDYTTYAKEFLQEIIQTIPAKEEEETQESSIDSGVESCSAMDCSEYESEPMHFPVKTDENNSNNTSINTFDILAQAEELLKSLNNPSIMETKEPEEEYHVSKETISAAESEEEFMDCEEYMEVDSTETGVVMVTETNKMDLKTTMDSSPDEISLTQPTPPSDTGTAQSAETAENSKADLPVSNKVNEKLDIDKSDVLDDMKDKSQTSENDTIKESENKDQIDETNKSNEKYEQQDSSENVETDTNSSNNQQLSVNEITSHANPSSVIAPSFNDIDDQPILPKRGVYNFDEIDFDSVDPFKPKTQIVNSPDKASNKTEVIKSENENQGGIGSPGKETKAETMSKMSPANNNKDKFDTEIKVNGDMHGNDHKDAEENNTLLTTDTSTGNGAKPEESSQKMNSENLVPEKDNAESVIQSVDFLSIEDPFKPKNQMMNSPVVKNNEKVATDFEKIEDPFKPCNQMLNSPVVATRDEATVSSTDMCGSSMVDSDDPFKPRSQFVNSPVSGEQDHIQRTDITDDSVEPQTEIQNSTHMQNCNKGVEKSEVNTDDVEFAIHKQTENSLDNQIEKSTAIDQETYTASSAVQIQEKELNLDEIENPFKTKSQVANSPIFKTNAEMNFDEIEDPFKPKRQMVNSPVKKENNVEQELEEILDPFKPKNQMANSPVTKSKQEEKQDPCQTREKMANTSQEKTNPDENFEAIEDPFKQKKQMANLPLAKASQDLNLEEIDDPFKPKKQMANSPVAKASQELTLEDIDDPFKPKKQMANSPLSKASQELNLEDIDDPFKPKKQMANSPLTKVSQDLNLEEIDDPFECKKQMVNSPLDKVSQDLNLEEIDDPFKCKKQIANSPSGENANSGINFEEIDDPFKPQKQMVNSPDQKATKQQVNFEENDPFKPKKQMANSPPSSEKKLEIDFENMEDPFKPKKQMANSPARKEIEPDLNLDEIEDPFKPKKQMANSPATKEIKPDLNLDEIEDPFKPKKQVVNSRARKEIKTDLNLDEIKDPFKPKKQMMNSPINKEQDSLKINFEEIVDPFKPKTQMQNSSAAMNNVSMNLKEIKDPFSPSIQMQNTPVAETSGKTVRRKVVLKSENEEMSSLTETGFTPGSSRSGKKAKVSLLPAKVVEENEDDIIEITSVTRRGDQPHSAKIANFADLDIDENQFVSAAQVFNDPGMLDLLEQFGDPSTKQQESSLSRMSLYVKFDPLVEAAPNPRRFSVRPDQIEKIREYGLDDCLLLLGTPPRKKRQSLSVSSIRNSICPQFSLDRERVQSPLVQETGEVDKILACSPIKHKGDTPPALKMPSLMGDMLDGNTGLFEELKYTETDMKTLRNSLQLELQGVLLEKEREKFEMKKGLETEVEQLKQQLMNKDKELEKLEELRSVCDMFEQTCMELKEKHKNDLEEMQKRIKTIQDERNCALNDVQSVEKAFTDLHKRYDKSKSIFEGLKKNEEALKKYAKECHDNLKEKQKQIATMKKDHEEKSKSQQQDLETKTKQLEEFQNKLEAQTKVSQMKNDSLEKQLQQKIAENKELTDICDKLLGRNG